MEQAGRAEAIDGERTGKPSAAGSDDPWLRFLAPQDGPAFLKGWLDLVAGRIGSCTSCLLFLRIDNEKFGLAASHGPQAAQDEKIVGTVIEKREAVIAPESMNALRIGHPVFVEEELQAVLLVGLSRHPGARLRDVMRELHWSCGWLVARLWQGRSVMGGDQHGTALLTLRLLAAADGHQRFDGAAAMLANTLVDLTGYHRAAIGMSRGGRVRLEAMSHTASFAKRSELSGLMEAAMAECRAQRRLVSVPGAEEGIGPVDLAHRALMRRAGDSHIVSVPLMVRGEVKGVVLLLGTGTEDEADGAGADTDFLEDLRLAAMAVAPLLYAKYREKRWISGRGRDLAGRAATAMLGRRPALALGVLAGLAVLMLPFFVEGDFRVRAGAELRGSAQQMAVAPQDGFIKESVVRAGDRVSAGDVLATLDDRDLKLEESRLLASVRRAQQDVRNALAGGDRAESARASAELAESSAALRLARINLGRLEIRAPADGIVVSGDLSQRLGAPVSEGDVLFEIARLEGWRVMIDVSEYDVAYVHKGQTGKLVLASLPSQPVGFEVDAIASVSDPADGENRFRVEASVTRQVEGMRPGMKGTAKVEAGRARYAWIWLHGTFDRLRLWFWRLTF